MKKRYIVYRLSVADELVSMGYEVIGLGVNIRNPKYKVFFFEDTEELRAAVAKVTASLKKK